MILPQPAFHPTENDRLSDIHNVRIMHMRSAAAMPSGTFTTEMLLSLGKTIFLSSLKRKKKSSAEMSVQNKLSKYHANNSTTKTTLIPAEPSINAPATRSKRCRNSNHKAKNAANNSFANSASYQANTLLE